MPVSIGFAGTQAACRNKLPGAMWDEFPFLSRLLTSTQLLWAHSWAQEAPCAAMCAGTSVKDSILVELSLFPLPLYCHLPPAQVLLKEIKCWTCCFEALRFSWNKWLLAAVSCLTCPVSNQGHTHWLHQRYNQRPSLTVPEKIEIETTLSWILLEVWRLSKLGHMPFPIQWPLPLLHDARENHAIQDFFPDSLSAARK